MIEPEKITPAISQALTVTSKETKGRRDMRLPYFYATERRAI
jgi:hypothetical protein